MQAAATAAYVMQHEFVHTALCRGWCLNGVFNFLRGPRTSQALAFVPSLDLCCGGKAAIVPAFRTHCQTHFFAHLFSPSLSHTQHTFFFVLPLLMPRTHTYMHTMHGRALLALTCAAKHKQRQACRNAPETAAGEALLAHVHEVVEWACLVLGV